MEPQKTLNSHSNLETEQSLRNHATWYQTILQGHSNQNSLVLAQKQTYILMEQDRETGNKPTPSKTYNGVKTGCSINSVGKIGQICAKK